MKHLSTKAYGLLFLVLIIIFSFNQTTNKTKREYLTQNKWMWVKGVVEPAIEDIDGKKINDIYNDMADKCYHDNLYTFSYDGKGSVNDGSNKCPSDTINKFNWTLSEDELMLTISEEFLLGAPVFTLAKINDEYMTLTWQYRDGMNGHFYTDTYKAVK
jgi:hypothetical protein